MSAWLHSLTWTEIGALALGVAKGLQLIVGAIIAAGVKAPWLATLKTALDDLVPNPTLPTVRNAPPVIGTGIKVLVAGIALSTLGACAGLGTTIEADTVDCLTAAAVPLASPATIINVAGALQSSDPQAADRALEIEGATVGLDAVWCAVKDIVSATEASLGSTPAATPALYIPVGVQIAPAKAWFVAIRGEQWLHGWHLANGKLVRHKSL
jgi:hypothetical protein